MSDIREDVLAHCGVTEYEPGDMRLAVRAAAFALRWAAANCTYDMRHEEVRHGDRERAIPVNDLEALADELEDK